MDVLLELLIKLLSLTVIMIFLIGLLFVMLISVVYIAGYVYDSIFGNSFISLGHFISGKYPKIKNIPIVDVHGSETCEICVIRACKGP